AARRIHDHAYADQADHGADDVEPVWPESIRDHAPDERTRDEHAPVRGQDPAEMAVRLKGRDETVHTERDDARADPAEAAVLTHALPDQPATTDLEEGGEQEEGDRAGRDHANDGSRSPAVRVPAARGHRWPWCTEGRLVADAGRRISGGHGSTRNSSLMPVALSAFASNGRTPRNVGGWRPSRFASRCNACSARSAGPSKSIAAERSTTSRG